MACLVIIITIHGCVCDMELLNNHFLPVQLVQYKTFYCPKFPNPSFRLSLTLYCGECRQAVTDRDQLQSGAAAPHNQYYLSLAFSKHIMQLLLLRRGFGLLLLQFLLNFFMLLLIASAQVSHWLPATATWYGSPEGDGSDGR